MEKNDDKNKLPLVGFFPLFYNLAETGRAVQIARRFIHMGGKAVFFSHGGKYEYLAERINCEIVKVDPQYSEEYIDLLWRSSRLETFKNPFNKKILGEHVENEIKAFKKTGVRLIVSTNNWPCYISARASGIPLIFVTPRVIPSFTKYPEDAEFFISRFLPESIKLKVLNWYAPRTKMYVRSFKKIAKKYGVPPPKTSFDINRGDYTFYTSFRELLGLNDTDVRSGEEYIGLISLEDLFKNQVENIEHPRVEKEIMEHVNKHERSILLTMGSSGDPGLFLKILGALNKTKHGVIAVYSSILDENNLPETKNNVLLKKFVPSITWVNRLVDLAITHGGEGTVYTAAKSGKPVIGFPMQFEQHLNLEMLVKHKTALIGSKKRFKEKDFIKCIDHVFSEYDYYYKNAQSLAGKIPPAKGDEIAAGLIINILRSNF